MLLCNRVTHVWCTRWAQNNVRVHPKGEGILSTVGQAVEYRIHIRRSGGRWDAVDITGPDGRPFEALLHSLPGGPLPKAPSHGNKEVVPPGTYAHMSRLQMPCWYTVLVYYVVVARTVYVYVPYHTCTS
jgi:hypothetical protein